jgi:hypothetical protein
MKETAQRMRVILTKQKLTSETLHNAFGLETLKMMVNACNVLDGLLRTEKTLLTSVDVVAIVMDDLKQLDSNLDAIKWTIKLKELKLDPICLN